LSSLGDRRWKLESLIPEGSARDFTYGSDQLRFSISWKAYCFSDEAEMSLWSSHADDLDQATIVDALVTEMCVRGVLPSEDHDLSDTELGLRMVDTFVRFPPVIGGQLDDTTY
jgi:hypothetical protein